MTSIESEVLLTPKRNYVHSSYVLRESRLVSLAAGAPPCDAPTFLSLGHDLQRRLRLPLDGAPGRAGGHSDTVDKVKAIQYNSVAPARSRRSQSRPSSHPSTNLPVELGVSIGI